MQSYFSTVVSAVYNRTFLQFTMHYLARTISYYSPQEVCSSSSKKLDMGISGGAGVEMR
jgi:hypothetical protein